MAADVPRRRIAHLAACGVLVLLGGCGGHAAPAVAPSADPSDGVNRAVARVLRAVGAKTVYVMAGDNRLRAGLGILDSSGLRPAQLDPQPQLLSNVAGNGSDVVIGAAGVEEGSSTDGVYLIDGNKLVTLAGPEAGLYGPTISSGGTVATVRPGGGLWTRARGARHWKHDSRLSHSTSSSLGWGDGGDAFVVMHANEASARLVRLDDDGSQEDLGLAHCAAGVLTDAGSSRLVTTMAVGGRGGGCGRAYVLDFDGRVRAAVPAGWSPLAWSADGSSLLLSRGHRVAGWSLRGRFLASADIGVHLWMAATTDA